MSFKQIQELRQKKGELYRASQAIIEKAESEDRGMTADEDKKWTELHGQLESVSVRIDRLEQQDAAANSIESLDVETETRNGGRNRSVHADIDQRNAALGAWMLGREHLCEERGASDYAKRVGLDFRRTDFGQQPKPNGSLEGRGEGFKLWTPGEARAYMQQRAALEAEARSQMGTNYGVGGDWIPEGFVPTIERTLLDFGGGLRAICRVIRTNGGGELPFPTMDDTNNVGELVGESESSTDQEIPTGRVVIAAFKYGSKTVKIPIELLEDSAFNVESEVAEAVGERLGRIQAQHFTTGDGAGKPRGYLTASVLGHTGAANDGFTRNEMLDVKHAVDPAYRRQMARWTFNDGTLKYIKKMTVGSADDRPLWQVGIADGERNTIDGDPYTINQEMPSIAASAKPVTYGAMRYYVIRDVRGMRLVVLRERYADKDQIGVIGYMRSDADLLKTSAIAHLQLAS